MPEKTIEGYRELLSLYQEARQTRAQLALLCAKIRRAAPRDCCPHPKAPCTHCALAWLAASGEPGSASE
ncbi:MAG: hypothetical protein ACK5AZ_17710 [Bryobacteraceae bacterium]